MLNYTLCPKMVHFGC